MTLPLDIPLDKNRVIRWSKKHTPKRLASLMAKYSKYYATDGTWKWTSSSAFQRSIKFDRNKISFFRNKSQLFNFIIKLNINIDDMRIHAVNRFKTATIQRQTWCRHFDIDVSIIILFFSKWLHSVLKFSFDINFCLYSINADTVKSRKKQTDIYSIAMDTK